MQVHRPDPQFAEHVRLGLSSPQKFILPRYFYDERGSELFDQITQLDEYYLTSAEQSILDKHSEAIVRAFNQPIEIVELGSGNSSKTRSLLTASMAEFGQIVYRPIDISSEYLERTAKQLQSRFAGLTVHPLAGTYEAVLGSLPKGDKPRLFLFLGSSVGNFDFDDAAALLKKVSNTMAPSDGFLIGFDWKKSLDVLLPAYSDSKGVTALFNKNILHRINKELHANFDVDQFEHYAPYVPDRGRIEMHLVSKIDQCADVPHLDMKVVFEAGDTIYTSCSYKYNAASIHDLLAASELRTDLKFFNRDCPYSLELTRRTS